MRPYITTKNGEIVFFNNITVIRPDHNDLSRSMVYFGGNWIYIDHSVSEIMEMIQHATHTKEFNNKFEELISS